MNSVYSKKYIKYKSKYLYLKQHAGDLPEERKESEMERFRQQREKEEQNKNNELKLQEFIKKCIMDIYYDFILNHQIQPTNSSIIEDKNTEIIRYNIDAPLDKYKNDTYTKMIDKFNRWFIKAYENAYLYKPPTGLAAISTRFIAGVSLTSSLPPYNIGRFYELIKIFKDKLKNNLNKGFFIFGKNITNDIVNNIFIKHIITQISEEQIKQLDTYYKNNTDTENNRTIKQRIMQIYNKFIKDYPIPPKDPPYDLNLYSNLESWVQQFQVINYNVGYPLIPYFNNEYEVMINRFNNWYLAISSSEEYKDQFSELKNKFTNIWKNETIRDTEEYKKNFKDNVFIKNILEKLEILKLE